MQTFANDTSPNSSLHALALIAPDGRWVTRVELRHNEYDHWYGDDGDKSRLGSELDGVTLDGTVIPGLAVLGPTANAGATSFQPDFSLRRAELTLGYGISKDLTAGVIFNFGSTRTRGNFSVSGGNVGWNPLFNPALPVSTTNYPFAPVGAGASQPLGTAGVQQVLSDPAFGFAYEPVQNTHTSDYGELIAGTLWRFYQGPRDSLVAGLGVRIGLGEEDDPDNLLDVPLDDGSNDLLLQLEYFRELGSGYDLRLMVKRTLQTADKVIMRVPAPGEILATASTKEQLERNLGDFWEYDIEVGKSWGDWRMSGTWHRYQKSHDTYRSDRGQDTSILEMNTAVSANQWRLAVSWSGIRSWQAKRLPLPLVVKLEVQETYEGRNFPDVLDVYLTLTSFF